MRLLEDDARATGVEALYLHVHHENEAARTLYGNGGFMEVLDPEKSDLVNKAEPAKSTDVLLVLPFSTPFSS